MPSLKLKEPSLDGASVEYRLHAFLMDTFGGYTAQAGNILGYWRDENGHDTYGEHREFSVASPDEPTIPLLEDFLARMAVELHEDCIYVRNGSLAVLLYPRD
ncbi:MAG: hypothetical protein ABIO24_12660 [Saprospiraceae bacterium]